MYDEEEEQQGDAEDLDSNPAFQQGDVQEQLDALEDQVDELSRMQEETLMALETLAQQLQTQRTQKQGNEEVVT